MFEEDSKRAGAALSRLQIVTYFLLQAVVITGVGLEVTLSPPVLTVFEGEDAIFTCSPLIPIAVPLLEQDGFIVTRETHPRISFVDRESGFLEGNRTYTLQNVDRNDNGTNFRCRVNGVRSNLVTLTVYTLPQITGQSGVITILEHSPTTTILTYSTFGIPLPHSYQWLHNGNSFQGNDRVSTTTGHESSLRVRAPIREDSGSYTLVATSLAGQDTRTVELQIAYNEFLKVPQSQTVPEGATVMLECVHKFGSSYMWRSNRRNITRYNDKVSITPTGRTLRYGPVNYTDDLIDFYCITRLESGHYFTSPSAILRVMTAPVVHSPQNNYSAFLDSDIILTFTILGHPSPHTLHYFKDGVKLDLTSDGAGVDLRITLLADKQGSLQISGVRLSDAGVYSLLARNSVGEGTASTQLIVFHAPIIVPHQEVVVIQVNKPAMVPCGQKIQSHPPASFTWTKLSGSNGQTRQLQLKVDQNTGNLLIDITAYSDSGTYICTAENSVGTNFTEVIVLVYEPSDPPRDLRVLEVGPRWVTVEWLPPENEGPLPPLTFYEVVATPLLMSESNNEVVGQSDSDNSIPVTPGTRTSSSQRQSQHQESNSNDRNYMFENTSLAQGFDPNTTCVEISCQRISMRTTASFTTYNLSGLIPAFSHEVVVHALSNGTNLKSSASDAVYITTKDSVPGIGSVSATVQGPGAAHLHWTLKFSGGRPVESFEIGFKKVNESEWWQVDVGQVGRSSTNSSYGIPPDFRSWIVTGLEAEEEYLFRVRAMNELGYGGYTVSLVPILSHQFGVPSPHSRPVITGWSDNFALVTSSVSKLGFGTAKNITVFVSLMLTELEVERQVFDLPSEYSLSSDVVFKFANLSYRGDWQFMVSSSNSIGESIPSPVSSHARDNIQDLHTAYSIGGPVVGCLIAVLNLAVLTMVIILFTVMGQETHRQQKNLARREVEMAQAGTTDDSEARPGSVGIDCPFSTHSLIFRSSPDGRSTTHVAPGDSVYAEIAHRACPIRLTFPTSSSSCTAV